METFGGILGGIGIFLVGMILLTDGLKAAAGDALRDVLQRFARGPGTALLSGTAFTALVQSSSATTLTTIGFVSAGLLTFPQAVGVIFGANLGTTSTGWLVSVIGFKVSLSAVAFPLVGVGALARILGRGRRAHAGMAAVGFGLIFVGIDVLQMGMAGLAERVDPTAFPGATVAGRIALVFLGVVMTVLMQSSSAAVATTLAGLHTGSLGLEQAALLVVGQNMGTTVKAALASIGGSVPVKRTALAHILFNLFTGFLALVLLPLLLAGSVRVAGAEEPAVAIAIFHSSFNLLGVLALYPVLASFSRLVERLVPERESPLTRHLDTTVADLPPVAVEVARRSVVAVARLLFERCTRALRGEFSRDREATELALAPATEAILKIRRFLSEVRTVPDHRTEHARHLSLLHTVDHLDGFRNALKDFETLPIRAASAETGDGPARGRRELARALRVGGGGDREEAAAPAEGVDKEALPEEDTLRQVSSALAGLRKDYRATVLEATAMRQLDPGKAWEEIEMIKTLDRLGYHAWRAVHHLGLAGSGRGQDEEREVATEQEAGLEPDEPSAVYEDREGESAAV